MELMRPLLALFRPIKRMLVWLVGWAWLGIAWVVAAILTVLWWWTRLLRLDRVGRWYWKRSGGQRVALLLEVAMLVAAGMSGWQAHKNTVVRHPDLGNFPSQQKFNQFVDKNSLILKQPPQGSRFSFTSTISRDNQAIYTFNLFAPAIRPNDPASFTNYGVELKKSQQQAKNWIQSQGFDPNKLYIIWNPDPASLESTPTPTAPPIPHRNYALPSGIGHD